MKSYTDLEQSKKLAEFLPHESADMTYIPIMDIDSMSNSNFLNIPECYPFNEFKNSTIKPLPCWSLAALLDILPSGKVLIHDKSSHRYKCICKNIDTNLYGNPIDACVAMIEKLHELKML